MHRLLSAALPVVLGVLLQAWPAAAEDPVPVHLARRAGLLPGRWYEHQANLWQQQLDRRPGDATGWYSLYLSLEYGGKGQQLPGVLQRMASHAAGSWQFSWLQARAEPAGVRRVELLETALARCADCAEVLEDLALARELRFDRAGADSLWRQLYDSGTLASGLLDYNYNLLHSVGPGAILVTGGDNDTLPAWMLQRALHVRADVLILNLYLASTDTTYLQGLLRAHGVVLAPGDLESLPVGDKAAFLAGLTRAIHAAAPTTPVYVALTVAAETREAVADSLHLTGLAARVATPPADELRRNLASRFRLDALQQDWYAESHISTRPVVRRLNGNYVYGMLALAQQLDSQDAAAASRWRDLALDVARQTGDDHLIGAVTSRLLSP